MRGSLFTFAAGRRAKWLVFAVWLIGIAVAAGPAQLPAKFTDAEDNESSSFLPGDAESTAALEATESLQDGELAPAVIVYRRDTGLTAADRRYIRRNIAELDATSEEFPGVVERGGGAFSEPVPSPDGKAAIVTADIKAEGESERVVDPVEAWREDIADPPEGLEAKVTGGAGFSADAIKIFENINSTLLLAAVGLVVFLLILIYRSPFFFLVPLSAVLFAEALSRSLGYGVSELGFTINSQSSSIMSVLVLGAGTDYALLLVARYREELHHTVDKHEAMRTALASAGPAIFASAATVIAALLCLTVAKVNGTAGLGPIGALGIFCAALSMLTLLPALLTIFGRRAFWPFVPHTAETAPTEEGVSERARRRIVEGGALVALSRVILAALLVLLLLPLVLLNWALRRLSGRRVPSLIVGPLDRAVFGPYEVRRHRREHRVDATHGAWKRVGDWVARGPRRVMAGSLAVLTILCGGFAFFSTDLTSSDAYGDDVESVEGQKIVNESFPAGATAPTDIVVAAPGRVPAVREAVAAVGGVESVSGPVADGPPGVLVQATLEPEPYSIAAFDLVEPVRRAAHRAEPDALVGGASAIEHDLREAAARDSTVIPPLVLVVVLLILIGLLRALTAPLILIGTVILSFLAALGFGYFAFENIFGFAGADPSLPLYAFVFLVALGVDYNIFLIARAREETIAHGSRAGILRALAVTGAVITSAGIVLAGTFSVLATLPLVFLTELGFVVAFGVLLDTFLVRSILVPAIGLSLGDKFWWPSALSRGPGGSSRSRRESPGRDTRPIPAA
jgi:RND superfamily putative drug exporter